MILLRGPNLTNIDSALRGGHSLIAGYVWLRIRRRGLFRHFESNVMVSRQWSTIWAAAPNGAGEYQLDGAIEFALNNNPGDMWKTWRPAAEL